LESTSSGVATPVTASSDVEQGDIQIGELLQALQRRKRLALSVFGATLLAGALHTVWQRVHYPVFQGSFKLLVSDPINSEERSGGEGDGLENLALQGRGSLNNTATLIQVLSSPMLLGPIEQGLGLPQGVLAPVITTPKADGSGRPGVLEVGLQWGDPVQGQTILKKISTEYLSYSLRQRQEKLTQGLAFLDQQAPELQSRVASLQNRLAEFRQSTGFVEPMEQAALINGQLSGLSNQRKQLEQEQARLEGQAAAVRRGQLQVSPVEASSALAQGGVGPNSSEQGSGKAGGGGASPSTLSVDLFQVERQLAEAEASFTNDAPQVRELQAKRARLRPLLQRQQLDPILASLSENRLQLAEIRRQQEQLSRQFQGNPGQMKQYEALQQQLGVARDNLTSYIKARESFRLQVAQRTVPWKVMVPPQFGSRPVKPSVSRGLLNSALLGAMAGVGLALLRDRIDHVFHNPKEISDGLTAPLLGVVPHLPGREGLTISQSVAALGGGERFAIKESLRNLFANFRLLRADKPVRLVAVTSSSQGEGKSTTTALFAQTLAQLGQRVLLVDADMRRPMLHRYLGAENTEGFSSVLTDPQLSLESLVQNLQVGLDLLSAGPVPPDPTQLLSSERCGVVVEMIRQLPGYDLVIFDTPPALLLSDPVLLAEHLDGLIFLVGLARVNRDLPVQALQRLRNTGVDVLGVLANQPERRGSGSQGYGYGYGYGYGNNGGYGAYAEAAERREASAHGQGDATGEPLEHVTSRNGKGPKKRFPSLKDGSRRLMRWLDERR
jgi:capsular exopolysaccharide synthesis family protein